LFDISRDCNRYGLIRGCKGYGAIATLSARDADPIDLAKRTILSLRIYIKEHCDDRRILQVG
jgi:hypothetical protein